jgi:ankyrin repeat protein
MSGADFSASSLVVAVTKRDTTKIITLLDELRSNLKRTPTLTSETVVSPQDRTPIQSIMHNKSMTSTAPQEINAEIPPAVIVGQAADANLHSVSNLPSRDTTSPPIAEPSASVSVHFTPPPLQNASASRLTVSNQEHSPDRSRSRTPKRHLPVIPVPGKTLFLAARAGNNQVFLRILQSGAEITEVESDGTTVLQAAAEENQLDVVLSLLVFGSDPNLGGGRTYSPLLAATDRQHVQVVAALLEAGADPGAVHPEAPPWMKSAFHSALYHQNSEILSMLLRAGADPKVVPGLLHYACSIGTLDIVKKLLDAGLDINGFSGEPYFFGTPLQVSVSKSRINVTRLLLEHGADPDITSPDSGPWDRSPLFAAVYHQNSEILSMLLHAGADSNRVPGLLPYVAEHSNLKFVKMMVEEGNTDVDSVDDILGTALQVFAAKGQRDALAYLLDKGADPNIGGGRFGSALNAAITNGHGHCMDELLG